MQQYPLNLALTAPIPQMLWQEKIYMCLHTCVVFSILGEEKSLVIGICQNLHSEITCVNYLTFSQKSVCAMEITHLRWLGI